MDQNILVNGIKVNSMDKELFKIKMDKKGKEFGKVENLFNGLMI
jgi:hypothetical protein